MIKSRNRVKTGGQAKKRDSIDGQHQHPVNGFPAAHPDLASAGLNLQDPNSIARGETSGNGNIAPQHLFDTVSLSSDAFASALPAFIRQPSPSTSSVNGHATALEPPNSYEALQAQNQLLRTRVSELEVINDLFRGRVTELEQAEQEVRRTKDEVVERFKFDLDAANARVEGLLKRLGELEGPARKRTRRNGVEGEDGAGDGA